MSARTSVFVFVFSPPVGTANSQKTPGKIPFEPESNYFRYSPVGQRLKAPDTFTKNVITLIFDWGKFATSDSEHRFSEHYCSLRVITAANRSDYCDTSLFARRTTRPCRLLRYLHALCTWRQREWHSFNAARVFTFTEPYSSGGYCNSNFIQYRIRLARVPPRTRWFILPTVVPLPPPFPPISFLWFSDSLS